MLIAIKLLHTFVWVLFVVCILGIFVGARQGRFDLVVILVAVVLGEVLVLVLNRMRCPLTGVAARYTSARADNFDIFLPLWLARHNKTVFGTLYLVGILYALVEWARSAP